MGDPPTASNQLTTRASRPHSEGAFFWSSVSRFPEQEGGRPAHGIDSVHNEGESPSLGGRFFLVECESIPRTGGWATRPRHRISSERGRVALTPRALFFGRCELIPRTGGWATRPRHRLASQRGRVALTPLDCGRASCSPFGNHLESTPTFR